jgi:hypothetical protein
MITLISGDQTCTVSETQAGDILKVQAKMKATTWELPSQYQLTEDGIIIRANTDVSKGTATKKGTGTRKVASE